MSDIQKLIKAWLLMIDKHFRKASVIYLWNKKNSKEGHFKCYVLSMGCLKSSFFLEIIWFCSCFSDPFFPTNNVLTVCSEFFFLCLKKVTFIHHLQSWFWGFRTSYILLTRKIYDKNSDTSMFWSVPSDD